MDWKEEPATHQQLLRLQEYGFVPTCPLTVTQAARLIRQYSKRPARPVVTQPQPAPALAVQPAAVRPSATMAQLPLRPERLSEIARAYAYQLQMLVHAAERALAESPDRPGARADVHSAVSARQKFWLDTCRGGESPTASAHALEFHQHFGAHFFAPSWEEVQEVLEALDSAMPGWDKDHPELFYETLKLNFPSRLRQK
jgi:hypothetical protein